MKKYIFYIILLAIILTIIPSSALAQSSTSGGVAMPQIVDTTPIGKKPIQNNRIENLRQRADTEIDRRVTSMQALITRIGSLKRVSSDQKTSLTTQIQTQITELTTLKAKIDADTDLPTLKTDVKSIINSYRIYALFMPKINILAASDAILETSDKATELANKLQTRIDQAKADGKDTTSIQATLTDMQAKVADAQKQAQSAIDTVTPLTPEGFPGNKTTLQSARKMVVTGKQDLQTARLDGKKILTGLKAFKPAPNKNETDTNTATSSSQ